MFPVFDKSLGHPYSFWNTQRICKCIIHGSRLPFFQHTTCSTVCLGPGRNLHKFLIQTKIGVGEKPCDMWIVGMWTTKLPAAKCFADESIPKITRKVATISTNGPLRPQTTTLSLKLQAAVWRTCEMWMNGWGNQSFKSNWQLHI